jgi:hypothetical protein
MPTFFEPYISITTPIANFATNLIFPGIEKKNSIEYNAISTNSVVEVDLIEPAVCTNLTLRDITEVGIKVSDVTQTIFKIELQNGEIGNAEIVYNVPNSAIFGTPINILGVSKWSSNLDTRVSKIKATFQNTSKVNLFYNYIQTPHDAYIITVYQGNPYAGNYTLDDQGKWIPLNSLNN